MDKKMISQFVEMNQTARSMIKALRNRKRNIGVMDVRRLQYEMMHEGLEFVPDEFIPNFKALEKAGAGVLSKDKDGILRWKWTVPIKDVVAIASGGSGPAPKKTEGRASNRLELVVMLGPDREASLDVPSDLSKAELDFLCKTLSTKVRA